jgi:hypothetical protein
VSELKPSPQAEACFGAIAADLLQAMSRAIYQAHGLALDAHISGMLQSNDTYGATLHVAQYEQLVEMARDISSVSVGRPADVRCRFELVVLDEQRVVLYPWRYATDRTTPREKAKMRQPVSDLRKTLLALSGNTVNGQLTFDHAALDPDELEAQFAEEALVLAQLAEFGQVVIVGFASSPAGLFDLGWGQAELIDESKGTVKWTHWEQLPPAERGSGTGVTAPRSRLTPLGGDRAGRFDDAHLSDDLGLTPRPPLAGPPTSEPEAPQPPTGSAPKN